MVGIGTRQRGLIFCLSPLRIGEIFRTDINPLKVSYDLEVSVPFASGKSFERLSKMDQSSWL